jgi:hypothetical protein
MAGQTEQRKGGKNLSTSMRRKERYALYKSQAYAKNKLKRILRSSGVESARKWARSHAAESVLVKMLPR